ncbi:unnamed protein product [Prunus armeniaca]
MVKTASDHIRCNPCLLRADWDKRNMSLKTNPIWATLIVSPVSWVILQSSFEQLTQVG